MVSLIILVALIIIVTQSSLPWMLGIIAITTFHPFLINGIDLTTILILVAFLRLVLNTDLRVLVFGDRFLKMYALLLLWGGVSLLWAADTSNAIMTLRAYIRVMLGMIIAMSVVEEERDLRGIAWACAIGIIYTGLALLFAQLGLPSPATFSTGDRWTLTHVGPNTIALQVVWSFGILVYLMERNWPYSNLSYRLAVGGLFFLTSVTCLTTGSRTAMITLLVVALVLFFDPKSTYLAGFTVISTLLVVMLTVLVPFLSSPLPGTSQSATLDLPFTSQNTDVRILSMLQGEDDTGRVNIWRTGLLMGFSNPILGVGVGNAPNNYIYYVYRVWNDFYEVRTLHNSFITIFAEMGIIGFFIFLQVIRAWFSDRHEQEHTTLFLVFSGLIFMTGMTNSFEQTTLMMLLISCAYTLTHSKPVGYVLKMTTKVVYKRLPPSRERLIF